MAEPIANDWKAIHDRMQQIKAGHPVDHRLPCANCNDRGWVSYYWNARRAHTVSICDVCLNPENLPRPVGRSSL
jgi:hypothetical protein